jgi:hypothetical protein
MKETRHSVDLAVVGGGMSGLCAAVAAARRGARVALVHDRPVLGGNASSEIRMWIRGAHGPNNLETGIIEEIQLENIWRNPLVNYSLWDSVLYEKARFQENLTLLLNASCTDVDMEGSSIRSVSAWQLTTETRHVIEARLFADCSGDSILAPLSGAEFRVGREAASEFNEDIEPPVVDRKTMGMSCLLQAREATGPRKFVAPPWAHVYEADADLPYRDHDIRNFCCNFWWIEVGGEGDSIRDTEAMRDELLKIAFGVWDHIKNRGDHGAENWELDWIGFLPGKRESRRYVGDHILTQNDVRAEGRFPDIVAYGGWSMDDHHPAGFRHPVQPTVFHPAPSPYGIPYRCLYSRNVDNLLFAGRNISATHAALSSTRVMGTCSILGQAVGTAAAIAAVRNVSPREVGRAHIGELQQALMEDDAYLPWQRREVSAVCRAAILTASEGDPEPLRNGVDRPVGEADNGWEGACGAWIEYAFDAEVDLTKCRIVSDSDLNRRESGMRCNYPLSQPHQTVPASLVKAFRIEARGGDGGWTVVHRTEANHQRLVRFPLKTRARAVRLVPEFTWGAPKAHLFAWDVA